MDLLGALIDPRAPGEPLYAYRERLGQVAGALTQRRLAPAGAAWTEAREEELAGRLGTGVQLADGSDDAGLIAEAESRLLTYDNLEERSGPLRWPSLDARGERPQYGAAETAQGGVASPESLAPASTGGQLYVQAGYVLAEDRLYYVPADLQTTAFYLPPGTTKTVVENGGRRRCSCRGKRAARTRFVFLHLPLTDEGRIEGSV